jgi:membrane dipeptidase
VTAERFDDWTIVDGLEVSRWDRDLFLELRDGHVSCVHVTCAFWEAPAEALIALARWQRTFREHADLIVPVRAASEIRAARDQDRVGVLLGFQNTSPIGENLDLVAAFHCLGVRVMQLTYNNQNAVGSGCYEAVDSGLARFGRLLVQELNDVGVVIDLSHVGDRTSLEAIERSRAPVAITHANPRWFHDVPRNKPDVVLHACAQRGGVIGVCVWPLVLPGGADCPWPDFRDMLFRLIEEVGIEHVALGTDFARRQPPEFIAWLRAGSWTRSLETPPAPTSPRWLSSPRDFPAFAQRLMAEGLSEGDARALMGENWLRLLEAVEAAA